MCYNKDVSIISYLIGISSCFLLYKRNYKIEALFYGFVIQMQLIEFLLWSNNTCNVINKTITKIGIFINHLQPFVLYYLITLYNANVLPSYVHQFVIVYAFINILYFMYNYKLLYACTVGIPNKKELQWSIQYGTSNVMYFLFVFMLAILCIKGLKKHNYLNAILLVVTFTISYYKYFDSKGVGTVWCVLAAYIPLLLNIIYTIDMKQIYILCKIQ